MKLIIVSDTYVPDVNGVARTLRTLVGGLRSLGHEVLVVTASEPSASDLEPRRVTWSVPLPGYPAVKLGLASTGWLSRLFESFRPEVIYVAVESWLGFAAIRAARGLGIPVVSGFHTNFHQYVVWYRLAALRPLAELILRFIHNRTRLTIVPSHDTERALREIGVRDLAVVGRGVDTALFSPAKASAELRQSWQASEDAPVALYFGRLAPEKNLGLLARAFAQVQAENPKAKCVVVGGGPLLPALRAEHPTWHFAGEQHGEALAAHCASADLLIFPSLTETFGNVVLEAMSSGLLIVAYKVAAAAEHLEHGINALLAVPHDEEDFMAQVSVAMQRWNDSQLRANARQSTLSLTWPHICKAFEAQLCSVLPSLSPPLPTHPST